MDLLRPALILLVAPALLLTLLAVRRSAVGLPAGRSVAAMVFRALLLLVIGLVLADARAVLPHDERAVVFALDVSESVSPSLRQRLADWARRAWSTRRPGDKAALVVFGTAARVDAPLGETFDATPLSLDGLPRDRTSIDQALRVAAGLLRNEPSERRVVLLSDGNGDPERAAREAMALASGGVEVTTVLVELAPSPQEVVLGDVGAPALVAQDEPFLLKVEVVARTGGKARLHVEVDGGHASTTEVELAPGTNRITLPQRLTEATTHLYRVSVESPGDGDPANNAGGAVVRVRGRPRVLIVQGPALDVDGAELASPAEVAKPLHDALVAAGFEVRSGGPAELPLGLEELARWDALVIGDISAERWSEAQMKQVERWVFDQGGGLVALGGPETFGLGGYHRTPIEAALPVSCSLRGKKALPAMALALVIDRSGSMDEVVGTVTRLDLAKEGAVRTLELLQPTDQLGVLGFTGDTEWIVPLAQADEEARIAATIRAMGSGGGTSIGPALVEAHRALKESSAQLKHAILLTDGKSDDAAWSRILAGYRADKVTLTTVGVGPDVDKDLLAQLAQGGGGRFFHALDARTVPRLLSKEAVTASRALLVERAVVPRRTGDIATDLDWSSAPPLLGYVLVEPKPGAEVLLDTGPGEEAVDGPLLARWRHGLGKSAAFTSDAAARWSAPWLAWPGYSQVLGETLAWVARDPAPPGFETTLHLEHGRGVVRLAARTPEGAPVNGLALEARIGAPSGAAAVAPLRLEQTAPGVYEATFDAARPGAYFAQVASVAGPDAPGAAAGSAGAVLAYPREYRDLTSDAALLERIARLTRGQALTIDDSPDGVFGGPRAGRRTIQPLASWLLALAGVLLVLDVAARRLVVPETLRRWWSRRRAEAIASGPTGRSLLGRLREHKAATATATRAPQTTAAPAPPAVARPAPPVVARPVAPPKPAAPPPKPPAPKPATPPRPGEEGAMSKLLKAKREARGDKP